MAAANTSGTSITEDKIPLLTIIQGNSQTTPGYEPFGTSLTVLVVDQMGSPVAKSAVVFTIVQPAGGNVTATFAGGVLIALSTTDGDGLANCPTMLSAGPNIGQFKVTAKSGASLPVRFTLSITHPLPSSVVVKSGDNQTVPRGQDFKPLEVSVYDKGGNIVRNGSEVTFTSLNTQSATFPGYNHSATSPTVQGVATSPAMTAGARNSHGPFQVTATVNTVPYPFATFNETVDIGTSH